MCDCIEKFNEHLKEFNTEINVPFWSRSGVLAPFVETRKIDNAKRGKPRSVMASHCPFCGVALTSDTPEWYCDHGKGGGCSCKDSCKGYGALPSHHLSTTGE